MSKLKELEAKNFAMIIEEDLGLDPITRIRYAMFRCSECNTSHKRNVKQVKFHQSSKCPSCANGSTKWIKTDNPTNIDSNLYTSLKALLYSIQRRCYGPSDSSYKNYGAKGVTVAEEWYNNPDAFAQWCVDNGYTPEKTIDKDKLCNELGVHPAVYGPATCMFTDVTIQSRYRVRIPDRKGVGIDLNGKSYRARITIDKKRITIGTFPTLEEAITARNDYITRLGLDFPLESL